MPGLDYIFLHLTLNSLFSKFLNEVIDFTKEFSFLDCTADIISDGWETIRALLER